ncbi:carboxymuconolactone decarboxylase family protein [Thalassobaculum fulvum]|uniref:carboxymuconolactone decarboxylase family protein n=1 Tax=Thalassobaculum fulvum TaxID=1633335 RepID=UPI0016732A7E|nr:carboxymuconolactone decarboxylase family protein [Thalassobaculum fulvum]
MTTREEVRRAGEAIREELFGAAGPAALANGVLGFGDLMAELVYAKVWDRPGLSRADRMAVTLGVLCAMQNGTQLRRHVGPALDLGLAPRAIVEILLQTGIYRGFAASETALEVALEVFAERGLRLDDLPREDPLQALAERGRELQAALHGERRHDGHAAPDNPVTGPIYPLVVQYAYGEIWDRPGLDRRVRALCAVACFAALNHDTLLRKFALSALNVGATREEVIEAIVQSGPYGGFAFMLKGLGIVGEAFADV